MPDIRGRSTQTVNYNAVSRNSKAVSDKQKSDAAKRAAKSVSASEARSKGKSGHSPQSKKDQSRVPQGGGVPQDGGIRVMSDRELRDYKANGGKTTVLKGGGVPQDGGIRVMSDRELRDYKANGGKTTVLNSQSFDGKKDQSRLPGYGGEGKLPDRVPTKPEKDQSRVPQQSAATVAAAVNPAPTNYFKIRDRLTKLTGNPLGVRQAKTAAPENPDYPFSTDGQPTYDRWNKSGKDDKNLPSRVIDRIAPNVPGSKTIKGLLDGIFSRDRGKINDAVKGGVNDIVPGAETIRALGTGKLKPRDLVGAGAALMGGLPGYAGAVTMGALLDEVSTNGGLRLSNPIEAMATLPGRIGTLSEPNRDGGGGAPSPSLGGITSRIETSQAKVMRMANQSFMQIPTLTKARDGSYFLDIPKAQAVTPAPSETGSKSIIEALSDESYNPANASFWQGSIVPAAIGLAGLALVIFGTYSLINNSNIQVTK